MMEPLFTTFSVSLHLAGETPLRHHIFVPGMIYPDFRDVIATKKAAGKEMN